MADETPESPQRWTAKRRVALVVVDLAPPPDVLAGHRLSNPVPCAGVLRSTRTGRVQRDLTSFRLLPAGRCDDLTETRLSRG